MLEHSPIASDQLIHTRFMSMINNKRLPPQYFYVLGHGNPDLLTGYLVAGGPNNLFWKTNPTTDLANLMLHMINAGYDNQRTIVFLACHLGNEAGSFAEVFSHEQDVGTVYAFTAYGVFGEPFYSAAVYEITLATPATPGGTLNGGIVPSKTKGHWRIFNTATAATLDPPPSPAAGTGTP